MADSMSQAPTLSPEDSASNVPANDAKKDTAKRKGKAGAKKSAKNALANDTPPGAVQVPKGGTAKTGKTTAPTNETVPLTGYIELDLAPSRNEVIPTFTVDVNPFIDLVDSEFDRIANRFPTMGKHIPFGLFRYYCIQLWWYRVLTLMRFNGQPLSTDQKTFLNSFNNGETYVIPFHIAGYLASMGNFMAGGEIFHFRLLDTKMTGKSDDLLVGEGWVDCGDGATRITTSRQFWAYAQLPVPAVAVTTILNEIAFNDPSEPGFSRIDNIAPVPADNARWLATPNIAGWINPNDHRRYNHQSVRAFYSNLKWTDSAMPRDMQTCYLFSPSSMRGLSEKLAAIRDLKTVGSDQLALTVSGSPIQAHWLQEVEPFYSYDFPEYLTSEDDIGTKATNHTPLALVSRFSFDMRSITPSFDFGYRLARSKVITGYRNKQPVVAERSNFQPWIYQTRATENDPWTIADPPATIMAAMSLTWTYGSASNLNVDRFQTVTMRRDEALQSSLFHAN